MPVASLIVLLGVWSSMAYGGSATCAGVSCCAGVSWRFRHGRCDVAYLGRCALLRARRSAGSALASSPTKVRSAHRGCWQVAAPSVPLDSVDIGFGWNRRIGRSRIYERPRLEDHVGLSFCRSRRRGDYVQTLAGDTPRGGDGEETPYP